MTELGWIELAGILFTVFASVIGHLLSLKDASQAEQIKELFLKHETDARALEDLRLKLAENHLSKIEVEKLFIDFKGYLNERFDRVEVAVGLRKNGQ